MIDYTPHPRQHSSTIVYPDGREVYLTGEDYHHAEDMLASCRTFSEQQRILSTFYPAGGMYSASHPDSTLQPSTGEDEYCG